MAHALQRRLTVALLSDVELLCHTPGRAKRRPLPGRDDWCTCAHRVYASTADRDRATAEVLRTRPSAQVPSTRENCSAAIPNYNSVSHGGPQHAMEAEWGVNISVFRRRGAARRGLWRSCCLRQHRDLRQAPNCRNRQPVLRRTVSTLSSRTGRDTRIEAPLRQKTRRCRMPLRTGKSGARLRLQ